MISIRSPALKVQPSVKATRLVAAKLPVAFGTMYTENAAAELYTRMPILVADVLVFATTTDEITAEVLAGTVYA
jgi:hypothetical protein